MTSVAQASSIIVLGVSTSTPSIIRLGTAEPVNISAASTPSIVVLGDPVPAVTDEKVAAIPELGHRHAQAPMIIRAGVVGGAFATPMATASAKPEAPAPTTPAGGTAPASTPAKGTAPATATPANGTAEAAPNSDTKADKPAATASASGDGAQKQQPQATPPSAPIQPRFSKAM